jgi:coenzyme F420-reducing hydrogenase beta subunit
MIKGLITTDIEKLMDGGFCEGCGGCAAIDIGINIHFNIDTHLYSLIKRMGFRT